MTAAELISQVKQSLVTVLVGANGEEHDDCGADGSSVGPMKKDTVTLVSG